VPAWGVGGLDAPIPEWNTAIPDGAPAGEILACFETPQHPWIHVILVPPGADGEHPVTL